MREAENARVFLLLLAARDLGEYLYAWGGETAEEGGFDCSGFVSEKLRLAARAYPLLYDGQRRTARGLFRYYYTHRGCREIREAGELRPGCIVFYRQPTAEIHHVAIHAMTVVDVALGGKVSPVGPVAFEAGGAGSKATSPRSALLSSAGVRLTATDYHGRGVEWVAVDPFTLLRGGAG